MSRRGGHLGQAGGKFWIRFEANPTGFTVAPQQRRVHTQTGPDFKHVATDAGSETRSPIIFPMLRVCEEIKFLAHIVERVHQKRRWGAGFQRKSCSRGWE